MANTEKQNKRLKSAIRLSLAILVLIALWVLLNDSSYSLVKKSLIKNGTKYTEMYAYIKTKPSLSSYFIVQNNDSAKTFFRDEVIFIKEDEINNIKCSEKETVLIYEKSSPQVSEFIKKMGGEELVLNQGTDIEFYAGKVKGSPETCRVGG